MSRSAVTRGSVKTFLSEAGDLLLSIPHSKPDISDDDLEAVRQVLGSGMVAEGPKVRRFEVAVADYLGLVGAVATSSGTTALFLALRTLEIGPGDEVIVPTYVCRSVMDAVCWTGATPVLCDVSEDWCINRQTVEPLVGKNTKAIIVVHTFGIAAEVEPIASLGIPVVEDCAQSLGGILNRRKLGSFGTFCVCSFQAIKLLCTGEGGMVLCKDEEWLQRLKRGVGVDGNPSQDVYRFPMTDIQAALGLSQLGRYERLLERRQRLASFYFEKLRDLPIVLPEEIRHKSVFFRFPLRIRSSFDQVKAAFEREGIQVRRGVDVLLHRFVGLDRTRFQEAERRYAETLSIPLYPALSDALAERVVEACRFVFVSHSS